MLANEADKLNTELKRIATQDAETAANKINTALRAAMCGGTEANGYKEADGSCEETSEMKGEKGTLCSKHKAGESIVHDILCVCSDNTDDACNSGAATGIANSGTIKPGSAKKLADGCDSTPLELPLDIEIAMTLSTVKAAIRPIHNAFAVIGLGTTGASSCVATGADHCVDYTAVADGKGKGFSSISWVAQLQAAAKEFNTYQRAQAQQQRITEQLASLKRSTLSELERQQRELPTPSGKETSEAVDQKQKECAAHKDNKTACENAKWKWQGEDETKGECKPKPETEIPAAGTGREQGGRAPSTGCERHGTYKTVCKKNERDKRETCLCVKERW
uniref:Variant surface glycoprotein 1125.5317 n=1 Tax=Trypanosoma brucei TaxID=5691 RepID=A0A1J0RBV6_9TRYP|nr:variant surface glycoprotein 1125.5317 [Trypanosoma brucei]